MKYIVIELQKLNENQVANIVTAHDTRAEAEAKFHQILAAAAVSGLPCHSAVMIQEDGAALASMKYPIAEE